MTCSSVEQFKLGAKIPSGEVVQPGDLYFWDTDGTGAGHVAIYEADGQVIHALNPQRDVIRSSTYAPMGGPMTGVRRIFPQENVEGETKPPKPKRRPRKRRRR
jgi:cell wall-associated NlpC family hydrolase